MAKFNHRLSYKKRRAKAVEREKPPVKRREDRVDEEKTRRAKAWFALLVLLPVAAISVFALVEFLTRAGHGEQLWGTKEFLFFVVGCGAFSGLHWLGWRPVKSYVFAHEFTHLVIAKLFGGKIYDWRVSAEGGYVETNKSNTWITLGPYLVPFYTLLVLAGFGVVGFFADVMHEQPVSFAGMTLHLHWVWLLCWLVGFTWCHHLTFTVHTLHVEQGDLTRNGEFFSLLLIFVVNLTLIGAFFVIALPGLHLMDVAGVWMDVAKSGWHLVTGVVTAVRG